MLQSLRIVHTADLHLGNAWSFLDLAEAERMKEAQLNCLHEICRFCQRKDIHYLLIAGDLFDHSEIAAETLQAVCDAFSLADPCKVLIVPGNHDPYFPGGLWDSTAWPANVHILKGEAPYLAFPEDHLRVYGKPFRSRSVDFPLNNETVDEGRDEWINILLQHGELVQLGGQSNYNPIPRDWLEESGYDLALLGHIHKPLGPFQSNSICYLYSGCPLGRGFDECGERGFFYGTITKELTQGPQRMLGKGVVHAVADCQLQFYPLRAPRFHQLRLNVSKATLEEQNHYVDFILTQLRQQNLLGGLREFSPDLFRITLYGRRQLKANLPFIRQRLKDFLFYLDLRDETLLDFQADLALREHSLRGEVLRQVAEIGDIEDQAEAVSFWPPFGEMDSDERKLCLEQALGFIFEALEGDLRVYED